MLLELLGINSDKLTRAITIPSGATLSTVASSLDALAGVSANIINKGDGTYSLLVDQILVLIVH